MPSAAYIIAGELTVERRKGVNKQRFTAGQAVPETVDTFHRGVAGSEPVVLIVFYAGSPGMPLIEHSAQLIDARRPVEIVDYCLQSDLANQLTKE